MDLQMPLLRVTDGNVPSFEQTISALGSMPAILYRALEFGTSQNRTFFEQLSSKRASASASREMIVRDQAKRFFERSDFQVEDEPMTVGNEPLSALVVRCGPAQVRVLKGKGGLVPGCGDSFRRRNFYNQVSDLYRDRNGKTRRTLLNLLVLWDFDTLFNLANLWLVCPMRAGEKTADVLWHWHEAIPYPSAIELKLPTEEVRQQAEEA